MSFAWGTREREKEKKDKQDHWLAKKEYVQGKFLLLLWNNFNTFFFFFKAVDYMKENKIDEAIHAFSNAIERQASWAKCFSLRGQCFMKKSNPQRFLFFYN